VVRTAQDTPRDRIVELIEPLRVRPGAKVRLPRDYDPGFTGDLVRKRAGAELLQRIDRPEKNWKFSAADLRERQFWDDYQRAYADMLSNTSTEWAPWYVIPADHKWFARIAAAGTIVNALMELDPQFPVLDRRARRELTKLRGALEQH
jgi:hypothetical protein